MAFPTSPTNGQTYTTGGVVYVYSTTTTSWQVQTYNSIDAASALAQIKTVDGAGTGLDADLLDGQSSAYFLAASSYTAADVLTKIKTVDGAGSGLDADNLDGVTWGNVNTAISTTSNITASGYIRANTPFYVNQNTVTANFTIPTNCNAMSAGPVTVNSGITVTIPTGSEWTIV